MIMEKTGCTDRHGENVLVRFVFPLSLSITVSSSTAGVRYADVDDSMGDRLNTIYQSSTSCSRNLLLSQRY